MGKILKSARFDPQPVTAGNTPSSAEDAAAADSEQTAPPPLDPQAEAARIIAEAEAEAHAIIARAEAEAEQVRTKARQVGLQTGYADGKQAAEKEAAEMIAAIKKVAQSATAAHNQLLTDAEKHLGQLGLAIAKKILTHALTVEPEIITEIVAEVIDSAGIHGSCYVRVHPEDYKILQPHWDAVAHLQQPDEPWELIADSHINRGGCMIDIEGGTIDARLQTKLAQIDAALAEVTA